MKLKNTDTDLDPREPKISGPKLARSCFIGFYAELLKRKVETHFSAMRGGTRSVPQHIKPFIKYL